MGNPFIDEPATREARVVQRTMEMVAGGIVLACGAALLAVLGWALARMAWRAIRRGALPVDITWGHAIFTACALALAIFLVQVGARLAWHRPNAHGSLLSPAGWATLGIVFVGVAAATSIAVVRSGGATPIGLDLGLLAFAAPCFLLARYVRGRSRRPR